MNRFHLNRLQGKLRFWVAFSVATQVVVLAAAQPPEEVALRGKEMITDSASVVHATASSKVLSEAGNIGNARVSEFLKANAVWLLPALESRRGLVYEYRQEEPYLERVVFDAQGNILARLESSKESPGKATRQRLLLADGRSYAGEVTNLFVSLDPAPKPSGNRDTSSQLDGLTRQLATGLAFECALTRLARHPDQFLVEFHPGNGANNRYTLVLRPKGDARLFTGTMLAFTSWAYMHDVSYTRAEIICDASAHWPIEEKDFARDDELKGHYVFDQWLEDSSGAAPGLIKAVLPYQKDGKDQALEMEAHFHFAKPGVWLLREVSSRFRGTQDGSIGTVRLMAGDADAYAEINRLIQRSETTEKLIAGLRTASGSAEFKLGGSNSLPLLLNASWSETARDSAKSDRERNDNSPYPLIAVYSARVSNQNSNSVVVQLEGLSTASWKEFLTRWELRLQDDQGRLLGTCSTNIPVRAEKGPTPFAMQVQMPLALAGSPVRPRQLEVKGTVERMTGTYHGHGMWMHFAEK